MLVYRIVYKDYSHSLFASGREGRWNGPGRKVIYTAESIALAFLENMVRRQGVGFNHDFKIMVIDLPDELKTANVKVSELEEGWRDFRDYSRCQPIGNTWYDKGLFPVIKVPSAVLPEAFNYVLNTMHLDFSTIKLLQTTELVPDGRIEELLKSYRRSIS
jgi:RES domain-containing protein